MSWLVKFTRAVDRGASRHRGFVTVLVLAVMGLLAALVMEAQVRARARLENYGQQRAELPLQSALHEAVRAAMQRLADDDNLRVDHPAEPWAQPEEFSLGEGITVRVGITDATARFDLNNLYLPVPDISARPAEEIVMDLFTAAGDFQPASRVTAVRDWVDPDQGGLRERPYYERQGLAGVPPNRPLTGLAELLHVADFQREFLLEKPRPKPGQPFRHSLRDLVTALPVPREQALRVNVNTAAEPVLHALVGPGDSPLVRLLLVARENAPLAGLDLFLTDLEPHLRNTLATFADVRSEFFEIRALAHRTGGGTLSAQALVRRDPGGKVNVVRWTP
jgi:type II secretory pathway component PulK